MLYASDIFDEARALLLDPAGNRYADSLLVAGLNKVQAQLFSLRPDCVVNEDDTALSVDPPVPVTEAADPMGVADKWRSALLNGLLAEVYRVDSDEHEANPQGKAAAHRAIFMQEAATL